MPSSAEAPFYDRPFHGAVPTDDGTRFRVWAPKADALALVLEGASPRPMDAVGDGLFTTVADAPPGTRYWIRKDGDDRFPDPASRHQPEGVHGPSAVVDPTRFAWSDDAWTGVAREDLVIYELHVGAFTRAGTFDAVRERLSHLADLGVTAVELMPVHDFPGRWNWGYDPAALFAPARAYGSPDALRRLVDAAHEAGLAVLLDVVYNHLGPDGAYVNAFAPYLTDAHQTPWGPAVNLDGKEAAGVRRFIIDNALHWLREYHVDGLRIDATHALHDASEPHLLAELSDAVEANVDGPPRHLIAEDHRNLARLVRPRAAGGYGLDALWSDDLHHQLRAFAAGDDAGPYRDFVDTTAADVATTLRDGWFFQGQPSEHFGGPRGTDPSGVERSQCVVFLQNHDRVGNRPRGDRLTARIDRAVYRALSVLLCTADELPLLFMGQEWAASSPFLFFTDHRDALGRQVAEGRRAAVEGAPDAETVVPNPQDATTFRRSRLRWAERSSSPHAGVLDLYRDLLSLRPRLEGPATIEAPDPTTLVLDRPSHRVVVSLDGPARFRVPAGTTCPLHTEEPSYTDDPVPIALGPGSVQLERAGAAVLRPPAGETFPVLQP